LEAERQAYDENKTKNKPAIVQHRDMDPYRVRILTSEIGDRNATQHPLWGNPPWKSVCKSVMGRIKPHDTALSTVRRGAADQQIKAMALRFGHRRDARAQFEPAVVGMRQIGTRRRTPARLSGDDDAMFRRSRPPVEIALV
jgi:hypothetical protein